MPWWLALVLGLLSGGLVGFVVGRISSGDPLTYVAMDAAKKAATEKAEIDAGLKKVLDETPKLVGQDLADAINDDFDSRPSSLPADHPLRRPGGK